MDPGNGSVGGLQMSRRIRGFVAVFAATAVLVVSAAPALAYNDEGLEAAERSTPLMLDALILRPLGLVLTLGGAVAFVPAGAVVGLMRPSDLGKPFEVLVQRPFRYTFLDPLGEH